MAEEQSRVEEMTETSSSPKKLLVPVLLSSAVPVFSGAAYLTGLNYHQTYFFKLGVPPHVIEKSASDYFHYAYMAMTESGMRLVGFTGLAIMAWIVGAVYFWQILAYVDRAVQQSRILRWLRGQVNSNQAGRLIGKVLLVPTLVVGLGYIGLALLLLVLVPPAIGQQAGLYRALEDIAVFEQGCNVRTNMLRQCVEVYEDEKCITKGFVVESSSTFIAIYENNAVRTLPVEGKVFVTQRRLSKASGASPCIQPKIDKTDPKSS